MKGRHMRIARERFLISIACMALALLVPLLTLAEATREIEGDVVAECLNFMGKSLAPGKSIVVEPRTVPLTNAFSDKTRGRVSKLTKLFPDASKAVISDFLRVDSDSDLVKISRGLVSEKIAVELMDQKSFSEFFRTSDRVDGWTSFHDAHPTSTGLLRFSRVGIDGKNGQALVYVKFTCGMLCGDGFIFFLKYKRGHWEVVRDERIWVS